jgi:hypothetical protein
VQSLLAQLKLNWPLLSVVVFCRKARGAAAAAGQVEECQESKPCFATAEKLGVARMAWNRTNGGTLHHTCGGPPAELSCTLHPARYPVASAKPVTSVMAAASASPTGAAAGEGSGGEEAAAGTGAGAGAGVGAGLGDETAAAAACWGSKPPVTAGMAAREPAGIST